MRVEIDMDETTSIYTKTGTDELSPSLLSLLFKRTIGWIDGRIKKEKIQKRVLTGVL